MRVCATAEWDTAGDILAGQRVELGRELGDHKLIQTHPLPYGFPFEGGMERPGEADCRP